MKTNSPAHALTDKRLQVAQRRLQESTDEAHAFEAIREIITNLLGSEEMGLFKIGGGEQSLILWWSFGIDTTLYGILDPMNSPVLQRVLKGEFYIRDTVGEDRSGDPIGALSALIPIRFRGQTAAVLAIRRLLVQKIQIDQSDIELLHLVSDEAGKALFGQQCSSFDAYKGVQKNP